MRQTRQVAGARQHPHRRRGQDHHLARHRDSRPQSRSEAPPAACRQESEEAETTRPQRGDLTHQPHSSALRLGHHRHHALHKAWALDPSPLSQGDSVAVPALQVRALRPREGTASPRPQGGLRGPGRAVDGRRRGSEKSGEGCCPGTSADRKPGRAASPLPVGLEGGLASASNSPFHNRWGRGTLATFHGQGAVTPGKDGTAAG